MSTQQLLTRIKELKQEFPAEWFDRACDLFGFEKVIVLLGDINA